MHRHIEIGLGVMLGLVVVNSAQAAPRDGRFVLKGHGTAAAARGYAAPVGQPMGQYNEVSPGTECTATRRRPMAMERQEVGVMG